MSHGPWLGRAAYGVAAGLMVLWTVPVWGGGKPVRFTPGGGVFTNEVRVELAVAARARGSVVRFTLDGSSPGPESPAYQGPIAIAGTTRLRARTFDARGRAGETLSETYVILDAALADFTSNLPLGVVATFGHEIEREGRTEATLQIIGDGDEDGAGSAGRNALAGPVAISTRTWINQRGRASTRYPKRSFTLKTLDEQDDVRNVSLLGLPKDPDWVLYAPYPDKTLMRDVLAYEMSNQIGLWAPRTRFIELFVQEHPGRLQRDDYVGVYVLTERVKRDPQRIPITRLGPDDHAGEALTGGYVFKKDHSSRNLGPLVAPGYPAFEDNTSRRTGFPTGPGGFPAAPAGFEPAFRGRTSSSSSSSSSSSRTSSSRTSRSGLITNVIGAPVSAPREVSTSRSVMIDEDGTETVIFEEESESLTTSFKTGVLTNRFYYVDPEPDEITPVQRTWLAQHLDEAERAISGRDFRDPQKGYAAFLDAGSFVDYHLLVEVTKNVDGFRFSTFFHKDRGGRIRMGPLWDWNLSFGNCNGKQGYMSTNWLWPQLDDREYTWFRRLFEDPDFGQRYVDRWAELRTTAFASSNLLGRIDAWAAYLEEAQKRNFARWPILGTTIHPNWFMADTYAEEVKWMRDWLEQRLAWIEAQFAPRPTLHRNPDGRIRLEAPEAEIYVCVDGRDPRAPGGAVAAEAVQYTEPIRLKPGAALFARSKQGPRWSGPCRLQAPN